MKVTADFPPKESENGGTEQNPTYWVDAFCVDIVQDGAPKTTEVTFYVNSANVKQVSKNISVRYYFDATGMTSLDPNKIEMRELYDQTGMETKYKAKFSGPTKYNSTKLGDNKIYYVEVAWDGYAIAGSNKKYQFALGTYAWQNYWDPTDDWSHKGLKVVADAWKGTVEKTDNICVYDKGVLVGGTEPDGTKPATTPTIKKGDINNDNEINAIDLALLKAHLLGIKTLTGDALKAADYDSNGSVDVLDLAKLKKYLLTGQ